MNHEVANFTSAHTLHLSGQTNSGNAAIAVNSSTIGSHKTFTFNAHIGETRTIGNILFDTDTDSLHIQATTGSESSGLLISGLNSTDTATVTLWIQKEKPAVFTINVATMTKTNSFSKSVQQGDSAIAANVDKTIDTQKAQAKILEPLFDQSPSYRSFLKATMADELGKPLLRWWCIPLFCIPGAGLATFIIPACRH